MRVICFSGPKTSGKDTAANYLLARNSLLTDRSSPDPFIRINFADAVKGVCSSAFGLSQKQMWDMPDKELRLDRWPQKSPRILMQTVAQLFRVHFTGHVWAYRWRERIKDVANPIVVVTDLRHTEELDVLDPLEAIYIYVQNDRVEAERTKGIAEGDPAWSDSSESFAELMKAKAHYIITNNGTIPQLHQAVDKLMKEIVGTPDWLTFLVEEGKLNKAT